MSDFKGFSPAAQLYASNFDTVKEMDRAYKVEVAAFLAMLEDRIREIVAPVMFSWWETSSGNRYWWLGEGGRGDSVYLWFKNDPSELDHTGIVVTGGTDLREEAVRGALLGLTSNAALALVPCDGVSRFNVFTASVDFVGDDFAQTLAVRIAAILSAMEDAKNEVVQRTEG